MGSNGELAINDNWQISNKGRSGSALKIYPARPETPLCVQAIGYALGSNF
jgi:hypothetical protein